MERIIVKAAFGREPLVKAEREPLVKAEREPLVKAAFDKWV